MKIETNFKIDTDDANRPYRLLYLKLLEQVYRFKVSLMSHQHPAAEVDAVEKTPLNPSPN
jgi:hypothetical protein